MFLTWLYECHTEDKKGVGEGNSESYEPGGTEVQRKHKIVQDGKDAVNNDSRHYFDSDCAEIYFFIH